MTPPDLWGYTPRPISPPDLRWLAVKDEPVFVKVTPPSDLIHGIDEWAQSQVTYRTELRDEWSPPDVTLTRGWGDCEDIALLKRAVLLRSGIPEDRIFFLLLHDLVARQAHAALIVCDHGHWRFIDTRPALKMTLPIDEVKDYEPLEAMQGDQRWLYGKRV